ncbi:MAG: TonB-dependent receptor [Bacteroidetes bacterium]|nr:TonB-dependent receptor [Bacteroidota bacterium]
MRFFFITWLFIGCYTLSYTQIITIKNQKGEPIEFVTLTSDNSKAFVITNSKGKADISAFKDARKIEIRMLGYQTELKSYAELKATDFLFLLTQLNISLDEMVFSATRWNQSSSEIPAKISTISPKEVKLQNPQTAADLLNVSGKIFIQKSQQGGGSPMIRGFATNRLLYTIDGVRMNTAIFRSGNIQNVISLDPFAIEHIEIFFGSGSVIYGSDAIGGVMSFQTLTPTLKDSTTHFISGNAATRYSSANNEKTGHLDLNLGWRKVALITSWSFNDYGDLVMGSFGPKEYLRPFYVERIGNKDEIIINSNQQIQNPSGYTQLNTMQKLRYKPNGNWDIQYGFHYSETSEYSRYDRHIRYKNGQPRYGEWSYGPQKWMMNNLDISYTDSNLFFDEMNIKLAQQYFEESRLSRDINKLNREVRIEKVDAYSSNLDFTKSLHEKNKLFYGAEVIWNNVTSLGIDENIITGESKNGATRYPKSDWSSYAVYLSNQHKFSEKWLLQSGVRYNQFVLNAVFDTTFYPFPFTSANVNNGALTGSIGTVFHPTEKWVLSTNFATAFRSPNVDDIGKVFDSSPGFVVVPNPSLKAEYAYNADVNIAKIFADVVKIDFSAYYTILQDAMVKRDFTLNGADSIMYDGTMSKVQALQNAAVAQVYGIQSGIEIKFAKGFSISSDFNYQIGEEEVDDGTISPSRHAPPWFGNTKLTYKSKKTTIQVYVVYSGEKKFEDLPLEEQQKPEIYAIDKNGKPWSPSWHTINFKAMYQFSNYFSASAGIENITDIRYRTYSSGIVAPGRNFVIGLNLRF